MRVSDFYGRWRMTWMETWDKDYMDEETKAFIEIEKDGGGEFHFGYVHGFIDWEEFEDNDEPRLFFTWEGNDEMDEVNGAGWLELESEIVLKGRIKFHGGDSSDFESRPMNSRIRTASKDKQKSKSKKQTKKKTRSGVPRI